MATTQPPTPDPFAAMGGGTYNPATGNWLPPGHPEIATMGQTAQTAAPATAAPAPAPATGGAAPQVQQAYTDVLNRVLTGPTPEAYAAGAAKGPEAAAFRIANRRDLDRAVAQNAEQSAYSGLSNVGGRERQMRGKAAESEAQFVGNLTAQRMNDRRNELQQAMQLAAAQGDAAMARDLQLKLAEMDAALKDKGINVQERLGSADIDTRLRLGLGDLDLRKLLGMSDVGFRYAQLQQMANQDALNSILQGI